MAPGEGDLSIFDVRDLTRPKIVGHLGVGFVGGVTPCDATTLLIGPRGPDAFVDVSDPSQPKSRRLKLEFADASRPAGDIRGYVPLPTGGRLIGITPYEARAVFVFEPDKDGQAFHQVAELSLPSDLRTWGGWLHKDRLYLHVHRLETKWRSPPAGIVVVDVSDFRQPKLLGLLGGPTNGRVVTRALSLDDNRLAVVWSPVEGKGPQGVGILDARPPGPADAESAAPPEADGLEEPKPAPALTIADYPLIRDMKLHQGSLYVAAAYQPGTQDSVDRLSETGKVAFSATAAVAKVDVGPDGTMKLARLFRSPGISRYASLAVTDRAIFVSDYNFGLWCIRREEDGQWALAGGCPAPAEGHFVAAQGTLAFATQTFASQMRVIDVADPSAPREVGYFWNQEWIAEAPAAAAGAVYLPMRFGVRVVDVRKPAEPRLAGDLPWQLPDAAEPAKSPPPDTDYRILVIDGRRAVAIAKRNVSWGVQHAVLAGYGLDQPQRPQPAWQMEIDDRNVTPFTPTLAVDDGRLYLNNVGGKTLEVYQLDADRAPQRLGSFPTDKVDLSRHFNVTTPGHFAVRQGIVYLLNGGELPAGAAVLHVVDFRDAAAPKHVRSIDWPKESYFVDMAVHGSRLYLQEYWGPIAILDLSEEDGLNPRQCGAAKATWAGWSIGMPHDGLWLIPGLSELAIYRIVGAAAPREAPSPSPASSPAASPPPGTQSPGGCPKELPGRRPPPSASCPCPAWSSRRSAPSFAGAKLPSARHSDQSSWPLASNSARKARQAFSQTPWSSHRFRRRQHVLPEEYRLGSSFQGAPVQSTHRMPSRTMRFSIGLRPPLGDRLGLGNSGSIRFHCSSVSNAFLGMTIAPSMHGQDNHNCTPGASLYFTRFWNRFQRQHCGTRPMSSL